ncbi:MAG TPA: hypothetical protein VGX25_05405 [Actinophytocola sp.]|uniref:hypothetical protein n=1 Tax=Actinophytocola sp. TaxID=1872138 RepID=UPI002DDCEE4F|nr:hypothetical protein [Actinophytocola sp.]HEV2778819.1 hypothetical protein [Actinophytocola sp.]
MADVDVTLTGPLFDGRADKVVDSAVDEAAEALAEVGRDAVRAVIGRKAKRSTGRFASRTRVDRRGDVFRTHTPGLRYGAWLEGTSRRNQRSTFKGHRPYREAAQEVQARLPQVADQVIGQAIKEIG